MFRRARPNTGLSLVELLLVLSLIGIFAALVIPSSAPSVLEQLEAAAQLTATDLAYARSLAVSNGSNYRVTFDPAQNQYTLAHVGTNSLLDTLPLSPYDQGTASTPTQRVVRLADLPWLATPPRLLTVKTAGVVPATVQSVEFGPLGETTRAEATLVWLAAGSGAAARFLAVEVNPVTGIVAVGAVQAQHPDPDADNAGASAAESTPAVPPPTIP